MPLLINNEKDEALWFEVLLSSCGVILNIIFIWINTSKRQRRAILDISILVACIIKVLSGIQLLIRSVVTLATQTMHQNIFVVSQLIDFILDGIYISSLLTLNIFRYLMIKNMDIPQDHVLRANQSKKCLIFCVSIVIVLSFINGIIIMVSENPHRVFNHVFNQLIHFAVKEIPWLAVLSLNVVMIFRILIVVFKRRRTVHVAIQLVQQRTVGGEAMQKQFLWLSILQMGFFSIPSIYVFAIEFIVIHLNNNTILVHTTIDCYWLMKVLLVLLNPVNFAIARNRMRITHYVIRKISSVIMGVKRVRDGTTSTNRPYNTSFEHQTEIHTTSENLEYNVKHLQLYSVVPPIPPSPISSRILLSPICVSSMSPHSLCPISLLSPHSLCAMDKKNDTSPTFNFTDIDNEFSPYTTSWFVHRTYASRPSINLSLVSLGSSVF